MCVCVFVKHYLSGHVKICWNHHASPSPAYYVNISPVLQNETDTPKAQQQNLEANDIFT